MSGQRRTLTGHSFNLVAYDHTISNKLDTLGRDFVNDLKQPAPARLSSTVLLLRGDAETEVLMVARAYEIDFASGAYVFPGGKVSEDDRQDAWQDHADGDFDGDERAVRVGGIREVFEESGILLARHESAPRGSYVGQDVCARLAVHRQAVDRGEESFLELIKANGLVLALEALIPFAHWITPVMMPKRFDTRFFAVETPHGQEALHDGRETTDAVWVKPAEILEKGRDGQATIIFPTRLNLEKLEDLGSVSNVLRTCRSAAAVMVLPRVERRATGAFLVIPANAGYRVTEEIFESVEKATAARKQ